MPVSSSPSVVKTWDVRSLSALHIRVELQALSEYSACHYLKLTKLVSWTGDDLVLKCVSDRALNGLD